LLDERGSAMVPFFANFTQYSLLHEKNPHATLVDTVLPVKHKVVYSSDQMASPISGYQR